MIEEQLKQNEKEREILLARQKEIKGKTYMVCASCKKGTHINQLVLFVAEFYVEPFSCTGGDYWTEGSFPELATMCPHCHTCNRLLSAYKTDSMFFQMNGFFREQRNSRESTQSNMIHRLRSSNQLEGWVTVPPKGWFTWVNNND